jgi:GDP-L-fucose synthase
VPSLIHRAVSGENPLVVWGDGSAIRDFIFARDVARGMMLVVEQGYPEPVNLGSGEGISIRQVAETLAKLMPGLRVEWDTSKPSGDRKRLMDVRRARALGFAPQVGIEQGMAETLAWYRQNSATADRRYNAFTEAAHVPKAAVT